VVAWGEDTWPEGEACGRASPAFFVPTYDLTLRSRDKDHKRLTSMQRSTVKDRKTSTIVNTLIGSGFHLANVTSKPTYLLFRVARRDEFGILLPYVFAYSGNDTIKATSISALRKVSENDKAPLVIIGSAENADPTIPILTMNQFVGLMGGSVQAFLPLEPEYPAHLAELGLNQKPSGLIGKTDDLFESYVHQGLQFILQRRVIRYGQDRLFETLPDGLVLGRGFPQLLYDCKAYKDGYPLSRDAIRQFSDYVRSFHQRYEGYIGRVHAFLVVSGKFQSDAALDARSKELYSECQVPLVFMSAETLGQIVTLFVNAPQYRSTIDWKLVFSATAVDAKTVRTQLNARKKDRVIGS
jgi:hypothetical protein